jgi:multiple sugar transport system ATP-binding protein
MKLTFNHLSKRFITMRGVVDAVCDVSLEIEEGEFFVLLGPSGCGKSTLLNLTAGLEKPTTGEILFDDQVVAAPAKGIFLPPRERNVAMVFQSYALYPHLNVFDNIAFPLRVAKEKDGTVNASVEKAARMLGIKNLLGRKPAELSGGQRQRVSIARAVVRRPEVFLLDEPLSNLDAQLRTATRGELKLLQRELNITTLYVTHDQTEAMTLGDRIALLKDGSLVQVGTPEQMYEEPKTPFAATFIGSPPMNLIRARVKEEKGHIALTFDNATVILPPEKADQVKLMKKQQVLMGIRPEHVSLVPAGGGQTLLGTVKTIEPLGREVLLHVSTECCDILVLSPEKDFRTNDTLHVSFDPHRVHVFDAEQ